MDLTSSFQNSNNTNFELVSNFINNKQGQSVLPITNQMRQEEKEQGQKSLQVKESDLYYDNNCNESKESIIALKEVLNNKIVQNRELKKNIEKNKNQINSIDAQVDKIMSKNVLKHSKRHQNVDIHSIFQLSNSNNPLIKQLSTDLNSIRSQSLKTKNQIKNQQNLLQSPQKLINSELVIETRLKLNSTVQQLKALKQQKQYLFSQLKILQSLQQQYEVMNKDDIQNKKNKNIQIINEIKQQKQQLYELQKQDRILTQKIKFLEQLQTSQKRNKKVRLTDPSYMITKQKIQENMKILTNQIIALINKRNKMQNQKKNMIKNLQQEVMNIENRNETIIRNVRKIDSQIINHSKSKLKKQNLRKNIETERNPTLVHDKVKQKVKTMRKLSKQSQTTVIPLLNKTNEFDQNTSKQLAIDFITSPHTLLMQKHKSYQFFMNIPIPNTNQTPIQYKILNDQIFGSQLILQRISFLIDEDTIFGVWGSYINQHGYQVKGWKIMPRIRPKKTVTKQFTFNYNHKQIIKYIKVGVNSNQCLSYIYFVTSEMQIFQWGKLTNCVKNQERCIIQYQSISIKGKLNQMLDKESPNYYCLGGFGLNTVIQTSK